MNPSDLSLAETVRAIAAGRLSARAATEAALDAFRTKGEALHVAAALEPETALRAADAADAAQKAGRALGPLHGVPLAHKAMFYRAGRPTDLGSAVRRGFVPEVTAAALERLDAAGAIDLGQLHMVEFALGLTGLNAIAGNPVNPWAPDRVPGGSSSGSAAAVAAGLCHAALGSDTGGSIRIPAVCCNLVGLKPTYGRISRYGAMPLSPSLDHVGALARTAEDAALMLDALSGHDPRDRTTSPRGPSATREALGRDLRGVRVALAEGPFEIEVDAQVRERLRTTARHLEDAGAVVEPVTLPPLMPLNALRDLVMRVEAAAHHAPWVDARASEYQAQTRDRIVPGQTILAVDYLQALRARARHVEAFVGAALGQARALLLPALAGPVPTVAEAGVGGAAYLDLVRRMGHFIFVFNYLGLPALSVPCDPLDDGSPMGVQLVAKPFGEGLLLRIAHHLDRATGFSARRPQGF